jgi:hypothetical protein
MSLPVPIALATVVKFNEKGRFEFNATYDQIRATQGHSNPGVDLQYSATLLKVGTEHATRFAPPWAIHVTTAKAWEKIRTSGRLRPGGERGDRNEIHFATTLPDDDAGGIISGLRQGSEIIIFLDTLNFLQNGNKLFLTVNHVALSPADIYSNYFLVAYHVATRTVVWYDNRPVNIRLSGDLLETCLKSEPLEFWPEEPWALSKPVSRAAVGRQVIVDAVKGK